MKVLVVGGGAREHALAWKFRQEASVTEVLTTPGNPGTAQLGRAYPVSATDIDGLVDLARSESIDLTVVGPEAPLERGLADAFASEGLVIFGPSRQAARLETSKAFAKHLMGIAGVPTARYRVTESPEQAIAAVGELGGAVALKADGLAGGKGVIVVDNAEAALDAIESLMVHRKVGDAGRTLVVEERLEGPEVSFFVVADGDRAVSLGSAQDHKRAYDDDQGPNTGGMGAFSPSPLLTADLEARVMREIVEPVIDAMKADGSPFRGFLYVGLMLTTDGPKVIEFNVRLGDPEAQVLLPRMRFDLADLLMAAASDGIPAGFRAHADDQPHVGVVLASAGYPDHIHVGQPIAGFDAAAALEDVLVFHGGTRKDKDRIVTAGGRVVTVVGRGRDFRAAIDRAYAGVEAIQFDGRHVRRDIGRKALGGVL
ncbi:MAG: phosphoribosylamine--glycine ligase [Vicinamibacteraceae bacterium]